MAAAETSPGDDTTQADEGQVPVMNRGERTPGPATVLIVDDEVAPAPTPEQLERMMAWAKEAEGRIFAPAPAPAMVLSADERKIVEAQLAGKFPGILSSRYALSLWRRMKAAVEA